MSKPDFRREFADYKRQGAQKSHWLALDERIKGYLTALSMKRLELQRSLDDSRLPFVGGHSRDEINTALAEISDDIQVATQVHADVGAELENLESLEPM